MKRDKPYWLIAPLVLITQVFYVARDWVKQKLT